MKNYTYHLIIGSNLGDRTAQLSAAKKEIAEVVGGIRKESEIFETQPWGFDDQPWFLNQVLEVATELEPLVVLRMIKQIEVSTGRNPGEKWHARHIDIDILLCGDLVVNENELVIPHPHLQDRNFVLVPLMDVAPEIMHPTLGQSIEELYSACRDTGEVYIFNKDEQDHPV
jgi:2-amino-4-hydroxy-6-hydroxymethyldihydropteridine diphosphokinase